MLTGRMPPAMIERLSASVFVMFTVYPSSPWTVQPGQYLLRLLPHFDQIMGIASVLGGVRGDGKCSSRNREYPGSIEMGTATVECKLTERDLSPHPSVILPHSPLFRYHKASKCSPHGRKIRDLCPRLD